MVVESNPLFGSFSISLYHTFCLSLSLWYGLEMEAFSSCLEIFRFTAYITGTFPVSVAPLYARSVCLCVWECIGMHSKVCHAYRVAFSSFAQIFTFRNHILLLESHAKPEEEPKLTRERDRCLRNNPLWLFNFSSEFFLFVFPELVSLGRVVCC